MKPAITDKKQIKSILRKAGKNIESRDFQRYSEKYLDDKNEFLISGPIEKLSEHLDFKGKKILDMGCGFGLHSLIFSFYGAEVVGMDMNTERLNVLNDLVNEIGNVKVFGVFCSALEMPFKNEKFDIVYCNQFISHVSDFTGAVNEAKRILKKDGILVLCDTNKKTILTTYFTKYSTRKKYKKLKIKIIRIVEQVIRDRVKEKNYDISDKDLQDLSKITMGMNRKEIYSITDAFVNKSNYKGKLKNIKVKFRYRDPDSGYYHERLFSPEEVRERMLSNGFEDIKILTLFEGRFNKVKKCFKFPYGDKIARRLFVSTYCVYGKK